MSDAATAPLDLFYSYSHKDERLRDRLGVMMDALKRAGLIRGWHDRQIKAGEKWEQKIHERLKTADIILLLVSPDFVASDYCYDIEVNLALERHSRGEARVIPVILRPCMWETTPFADLQAVPKLGKPVTKWSNRDEAFLDVAEAIRNAAAELAHQQIANPGRVSVASQAIPAVWNVPNRNFRFTGREKLLQRLKAQLLEGKPVVLTQRIPGLGGVGKTQVALEYAHRNSKRYRAVWWITAEERSSLVSEFASLAQSLGLGEKDEIEQRVVVDAVRRWLDANGEWLLIFDNAQNPRNFSNLLPHSPSGHVIITSRNPDWGPCASLLALDIWERDESIRYLLARTKQDDQEAANSVAETLGDLPLALEQAAAFLAHTGTTLTAYAGQISRSVGVTL